MGTKKLTITECKKFLKDKKNMQYENLYRMIQKYVSKYENYESQYMIRTSNVYRKKQEAKKLRLEKLIPVPTCVPNTLKFLPT